MPTIALLIASNIFMTTAWYGHLKFPNAPLWKVILIAWGIALLEYCLAVPANRIGYQGGFSAAELKIIQEVIALAVFAGFALIVLKEPPSWRYLGACLCMVGAVAFLFAGKSA